MFLVGGVWEVLVHKYSRTSELPESCGGRSLKEVSWACLPVPACVGDLEQLPFLWGVCVFCCIASVAQGHAFCPCSLP